MNTPGSVRVVIVHEWLTTYAGSERVLEQMLLAFPRADLFALVDFLQDDDRAFLRGREVRTSFIQRLPFARGKYRSYLPLMPLAVEQFDLSEYDIVISSSHAVAKGVLVGPDQLHICMCYSPIRYAWDLQHQYLAESGLTRGPKAWMARWFLHKMRLWDARTAAGVDCFIAISRFVGRRIQKVYRRESTVIYPPVDVEAYTLCPDKNDYYVAASRLVPYKKLDLIARAFSGMPDRQLVIIGDGPDRDKVEKAAGENVQVLGYQPFDVLRDYLQRARAFVFAAEEDFGILPVEAQACGTPVVAYRRGGAGETVRGLDHPRPTGVFFDRQTPEAIQDAVRRLEENEHRFDPEALRGHAQAFAVERFQAEFQEVVQREWVRHSHALKQGGEDSGGRRDGSSPSKVSRAL